MLYKISNLGRLNGTIPHDRITLHSNDNENIRINTREMT